MDKQGLLSFYRNVVNEIYEGSVERGGRLVGSEGDRWIEDYLKSTLEGMGLEVHVDGYETKNWIAKSWLLEVYDGSKWVEAPSYFMARTGPGSAEGRLAYIGDAHSPKLPRSLEGFIAVSRLVFPSLSLSLLEPASLQISDPDGSLKASALLGEAKPSIYMTRLEPSECGCPVAPVSYEAALNAGASGFAAILENYPDMGCGEFTYYAPADGEYRRLPGVWVERSWSRRLEELAKASARTRLALEADVVGVEGRNVYALIPGREEGVVVIHSHHDAPYGGAVQDASGVAMVLLLAKIYSGKAREGWTPRHTLMFLFTEGHFDAGSGQLAFLKSHSDIKDKILVDIAIEHIGLEYAVKEGMIYPTGRPEPRALFVSEDKRYIVEGFKRALEAYKPKSTLMLPTNTILGVPSDANKLWRNGIPVASLISGPLYMFSSCDSPEKVDYESIEALASMYQAAIDWILKEANLEEAS
jgi:hypothetical protein